MKKKLFCSLGLFFIIASVNCQATSKLNQNNTPKVILITLDGLRWQEVFTGADSVLLNDKKYTKNSKTINTFWKKTPEERRETLLPFLWKMISSGTILGNRNLDNKVNVSNKMWFSYPGYSEILCGFADDSVINSNDKLNNPNTTILEIVNNTQPYKNKVAAFGSWDVFPYIINRDRSKLLVNAGYEIFTNNVPLTANQTFINKIQNKIPPVWDEERYDVFTHYLSLDYLKTNHPNLLFISYGETDLFAHGGNYDRYLNAAHNIDNFIRELWETTQADPFYKNNTTFIITVDHGRGQVPINTWTGHGCHPNKEGKIECTMGSDQVWILGFGEKIKSLGEVNKSQQFYSNQIASTIASLLKIKVNNSPRMNKETLPILTLDQK